jgi:uncharacterized damage-inducible protein DinB
MNYYGAKDLAEAFRTVRKNTVMVAEDIPEEKYSFQAAPETRTVAQTLAHLAVSPRWQKQAANITDFAKFDFMSVFGALAAEEQKSRSKAELIALLKSEGEETASFLEGLSDEFLAQRVELPFGSKTRFEMLLGTKEHEMHHRAQLMQIERMIGIVPHLTRQMQQRMAERAQAATTKP